MDTKKIAVTLNPGSLRKHQREWSDHVKDDRQGSVCHPAVDRQLKLKDGDYLTKSLTIRVLSSRPHMWHTWCVSLLMTQCHHPLAHLSRSLSKISFYIKVWPRFPHSWWVWASYLMIYISPQSPVMVQIQTPLTRQLRSPPESWAWGRVMIPSESYLIKS